MDRETMQVLVGHLNPTMEKLKLLTRRRLGRFFHLIRKYVIVVYDELQHRMDRQSWQMLRGHLKNTMKKLKLLTRRRLCRISDCASDDCWLSINSRRELKGFTEDEKLYGSLSLTRTRPASSNDSEDDIDMRAEIFIADFRNQLRLQGTSKDEED